MIARPSACTGRASIASLPTSAGKTITIIGQGWLRRGRGPGLLTVNGVDGVSYQEDDYRQEEYEGALREEDLLEFEVSRLQSYYRTHDDLLSPPRNSLERARKLLEIDETASFVFGVTTFEIIIRAVLLRPMLFGLVHQSNAEIVSKLLLDQSGMLRHTKLLTDILRQHGDFDLETYKRHGSSALLLKEVEDFYNRRNGVVHRGEHVGQNEATVAIAIGRDLLEHVVPIVLRAIGLKVRPDGRIDLDRGDM
jgi:hypothetical protein